MRGILLWYTSSIRNVGGDMKTSNQEKTGFAIAALVLGIIGVVLAFIPIINNLAFVLGVLAIIFAVVALVKKASKGMAIASLILGVAALGITLAVQAASVKVLEDVSQEINQSVNDASGENTSEILGRDVEVSVGSFVVTTDEYGISSSAVKVDVTNKLTTQMSYTIQIEAKDAEGNRVADDTVYANNLGAGQSQSFDAFVLVTSDKYEALKAATLEVVSVTKF